MGAGKTTIARAIGLPHVETDADVPIALFDDGEPAFRAREAEVVRDVLARTEPLVVDLGGGAVTIPEVRALLKERATVVWLDVDVDTAWERVRGSDRPLAQDREEFERLYEERRPLYAEVADVVARDADDVVLAAAGVHVERGALGRLGELVPGGGAVSLVTDPNVAGIHGADAQLALGPRLAQVNVLPAGEDAKTADSLEWLWRALNIDRSGTIAALGGGCTTDAAGFAAATYLRGVDWVPVPTSLLAQVDAAIGGKTAIDLPQGKNLVGAFHWPVKTVVDPALLETLPEAQRLEGMAEVVKAGLLAGEPFWELPDDELVRRSIAFKAAICLRDPYERGERTALNLGHTFAHALEAAAGYEGLTHGRAVALGLLAALRLSGRDTEVVQEVLRPQPVGVDRERAWEAMKRDKKARDGVPLFVLLGDDGPRIGVAVPEEDARRELDRLIA
ncbi:MAG TPA: bifunctional shikimate kinase/3-dehydroquinate synthase [Gaiellaceae bacterium]|jgi:shikimate kinase/3-dehydroquinate synthase